MTPLRKNCGFVVAAILFVFQAAPSADYYPLGGLADPAGQLQLLAKQCSESPAPELLTTTGWLFHLYGKDNQKARELFDEAVRSQPQNPWARYGLCVMDEIKGDFDSVLTNSLAICESSPSHPLATLAVFNLRDLFGQVGHFNDRVQAPLKALLAEKRSRSVQLDEICREILFATSQSRGDDRQLRRFVREGGYVASWRIVGPFGEFPNLSFLSRWQPESDRFLRSRYIVGDRVLKPRSYSAEYGHLRPHWVTEGVYYAEAFLRSPSRREVLFRISSYSSVELFLNNHRIYTKDAIRSFRPVTEYVKSHLSPGYNRLLLKFLVGTTAFYRGDIPYKGLRSGCAVSDLSAMSPAVQVFRYPYGAADFSVSRSRQRWTQAKQVQHSECEPEAFVYFSSLLAGNPQDPLASGICGILRSVQGDFQGARRFLLSAVEHAPSCSYFNYVLGMVVRDDPALPMQIRQSEAGAAFRSALEAAGTFPLALFQTALLDLQENKELEAIDTLNQCIAESPGFLSWHETLYALYKKKEWHDEQHRELQRIIELRVETCVAYHLAEEYYRTTKQYDRLGEAVEKLQKTHVNPEFLARYCSESGRNEEAIAEYLKLKAAQPHKEHIRRTLAELFERSGRWGEAERELREGMKLFPKELWFLKELAELKGYTGRSREERRTWDRVLRENPVDRDARRALEAYGVKDLLDDFDIASEPHVHSDGVRARYAGVSSAMIIDQAVEEIYPNCSSRQKTHQLILLNDKKAIDQWGEVNVPGEEILELRTLKGDGTIVEPEHPHEGKATISMGGLQEGDFIELKYITRTPVSSERPRRYLGQRFFFQSVEVPMELSQYIVVAPEEMKLEYEQVNFSQPPLVTRKDGKKTYKWEVRDVSAIPREPLAAPETEFLPFVRVGVNYDEDAEILAYLDHNVAMTRVTDEVREITAKVIADCPDDPESRARAIYSFVNREVRGGGGSPYLIRSASETLADRRGDRLSLAKAMLDAAGIESRMLVVREELSPESKVFPGPFAAALLAVLDSEGRYVLYLDFSSRYLPFGYVVSSLQGGTAVPLEDFSCSDFGLCDRKENLRRKAFAVPRFPMAQNREERALDASVADDGSIQGTQVLHYTGDGGASLRASLMTAEAYQVRDFIEGMANVAFRAASLTYHKVDNLSDPEKPLLIEYGFRAPNFARVVGNEMLLDQWLPPLRLGARFATLGARKTPLQISRDFNTRFRGMLRLPSRAERSAGPPPLDLETDFGFYHLRVAKLDSSIHIEGDFHLKAQRISPQDYPRFVEFCHAVDAAERKEIRIRLSP